MKVMVISPTTEQILDEKEAVARRFVGDLSPTILEQIVCGEPFPGSLTFSRKRLGVFERAALIVLDVMQGLRPTGPEEWSKAELELRIAVLKKITEEPKPQSISAPTMSSARKPSVERVWKEDGNDDVEMDARAMRQWEQEQQDNAARP
jgi:hypothetical protein